MLNFLISSNNTRRKNPCLKNGFPRLKFKQGNDRANIKAGLFLKVGQVHVTIHCTRILLRYEVTPSDIWTISDFARTIFNENLARKL